MAISIEKNELYIIFELVDGPNLEELIFFETDDQPKFTIGKNCVQVIHRDIKLANILISQQSGVAKLWNIGISKFKEIQTMTRTTSGIPETTISSQVKDIGYSMSITIHKLKPLSHQWYVLCFMFI